MEAASPAVSKYSKRERTPSTKVLESTASAASIQKVREQIQKTEKNEPIAEIPPSPSFDFIVEEDEEILSDCAIIGLKELAYAIFSKGAVDKYLEGVPKPKISKKIRQIWELAGIEAQCNAIIGTPINNETKCWICGFEVDEKLAGLKPSCEHVLPVAQARFFLDLYNPDYELTPGKQELLSLEYGWSHFFCNLMKGSGSYIKTSGDSSSNIVWRPNRKSIIKTIDNILDYNTGKKGEKGRFFKDSNDVIMTRIKGSRDAWRQSRIDDIINQKINPILEYLQGPRMESGRAGLIMLAGVASCMNEDVIRTEFNKFLEVYKTDLTRKEDEAASALIEMSKAPGPASAYPFEWPPRNPELEATSPPPSKRSQTARVLPPAPKKPVKRTVTKRTLPGKPTKK
jgi:hypothetical protein